MGDSQDLVATILARYRQLCADHDMAQENIERVQAHQRDLMEQIADCFAAARLFGIDLLTEFERDTKGDPRQPILLSSTPFCSNPTPVHPEPVGRGGASIRSLVLEAAQKAHPNAVRAVNIRRELAGRGYPTPEKTVGMTLYRLSKSGLVRRDGVEDWYFVPATSRPSEQINGHKHTPQADFLAPARL